MMDRPIPAGAGGSADPRVPWTLRIGVAGCFIGHGAFGVITKAAWLPYFAIGGIHGPTAWSLMPWIGAMDILLGCIVLVRVNRPLLAWMTTWAIWTALLRPLSGEPFWETLERAGNYGVPLALLLWASCHGVDASATAPHRRAARVIFGWFERWPENLAWILRVTTATLLAGHAGLGLFARKALLTHHYAALGFSNAADLTPLVGVFEFGLAALALLRPRAGLFLGICCWKLATESLFLVQGAPVWEVVERCGSYAAPLALAFLLGSWSAIGRHFSAPATAQFLTL